MRLTDDQYLDMILIDALIQISQGVDPKKVKVRYTKEELENFLMKNNET